MCSRAFGRGPNTNPWANFFESAQRRRDGKPSFGDVVSNAVTGVRSEGGLSGQPNFLFRGRPGKFRRRRNREERREERRQQRMLNRDQLRVTDPGVNDPNPTPSGGINY